MDNYRLSRAPISMKLAVTSLLCVVGLIYLSLIIHIWQDTEMKPALIAKGYASMEALELTDHIHKYLPYYAIYIFCAPTIIFMFTSYSEKLKRIFAVVPGLLIIADIGSMCLIPFVSKSFSWGLFFAGVFLALTFLFFFVSINYDVWLKKTAA